MKIIFISLFLTCSTVLTAQNTIFQSLQKHGEDATYQRYYSVYKDDNGKQVISGKQYQMTAKINYAEHVASGLTISYTPKPRNSEGSPYDTNDAASENGIELVGFPHTSYIHDTGKKKVWVVIDDYIFKLSGFSKETLSFTYIDELYIRVGSNGESKKSKKKKGGFLKKLKEAATGGNSNTECTSPECKKAASIDLFAYVQDYLQKMKLKQDGYTLTTKDKEDLAIIEKAKRDHFAGVNDKNEAYWNSAEGRAIRRNQQVVDDVHADHLRTCKLYSCDNVAHK